MSAYRDTPHGPPPPRVERVVDVLRHRAKRAPGRARITPPQWALIHAELARARGRGRTKDAPIDWSGRV